MATKSAENPAVVDPAAAEVVRTKRVIIQRPADNRDIGIYLGFNSVGSVYPFDVPVELPADMVDYFRAQKVANAYPGEDGKPVISYVTMLHISDA